MIVLLIAWIVGVRGHVGAARIARGMIGSRGSFAEASTARLAERGPGAPGGLCAAPWVRCRGPPTGQSPARVGRTPVLSFRSVLSLDRFSMGPTTQRPSTAPSVRPH